MHRFKWEWDSTTIFNQFVAFVVNPLRSKMSAVLKYIKIVQFSARGWVEGQ